jgi:netrin receptor unc-5
MMKKFYYLIFISLLLLSSLNKFVNNSAITKQELKFYEEPTTTYLTKNTPAILKCKIENARTGFFKCNDKWSQDGPNYSSKIIQIGNKQILYVEQAITKSQLDEYKKSTSYSNQNEFWCTCQGWLNNADDTLISQKAFVKLAYIDQRFEWEPFPTSGLIGKSVEIRCLPPEGEPKPTVYWLKNNQLIEKSNKRILISNEGSLLINEVRLTDSANYTCIAENLAGKRFSDPAELTVVENKGWSDWSNWTECTIVKTHQEEEKCGEGIQKRTRECLNPPTINNAIGCDGFPIQTITCYIACNSNNIINKISSTKTNLISSQWSQWSSWSIDCKHYIIILLIFF